jgi:hypothetical protein
MATKVTRDGREKDLKAMVASAMLGGGIDGVMTNILDLLDDLDDAITFFAQWKRGTLLDLEPGQKLDRWESTVLISRRMDRDPEFYAEMLRQPPRYLVALMAHEVQGLPIVDFLRQVKEVRFVEEEPGLHWLLLPACHRGCDIFLGPEAAHSHGSCTMCGRPKGAASSGSKLPSSLATTLDRIHAVDDYLVRSLDADRSVRDRVMKDPTEAFAQASQTLFGARPEELFGIREVQLAVDTDTMVYVIHLAEHKPKRTAVATRAASPKGAPVIRTTA